MHSIKNSIVAVGLLAASFALYHVSLTPDNAERKKRISAVDLSGESGHSSEPAVLPESAPSLPPPSDLETERFAKTYPAPAIQPSRQPPTIPHSRNRAQALAQTEPKNSNNDFMPYPAMDAPRVAQREPLASDRDQGLIKALQTVEPVTEPSPSLKNSQPPVPADSPELSAGPASATEFDPNFSVDASIPSASFTEQANNVAPLEIEGSDFSNEVVQASVEPALETLTYSSVWPKLDELTLQQDYKTALQLLSRIYREEELTGPQKMRILGWLDALAGKVIFSSENYLATTPYRVGEQETLADIAAQWNVPAQLIYNVNQQSIPNPANVPAGTELKQIQGPFRAEISLVDRMMTLYLDDLYAGRFPIRVGSSGTPRPGEFGVVLKSKEGFTWRDSTGTEYAPDSPDNGYGPNWIGLSGSLCIHAVDDGTKDGHHGCIGLNSRDAEDLFAILSENSTVTIVR